MRTTHQRDRSGLCRSWWNVLLYCFTAVEVADAFTITTFNILAPVHRSIDSNHRESEREDWWRPRAEAVATYISENFVSPLKSMKEFLLTIII